MIKGHMFVICLIISYNCANNLSLSQLIYTFHIPNSH